MKFKLEINTANAAFETDGEYEIARLLKLAAKAVTSGDNAGSLYDYNGNHVGNWSVK